MAEELWRSVLTANCLGPALGENVAGVHGVAASSLVGGDIMHWPIRVGDVTRKTVERFHGPIMVQLTSTYSSSRLLNVPLGAIRIASFQ